MRPYTIFILILFFTCSCLTGREYIGSDYMEVIRVIDGDTFVADDGSEKGMIIRLIGVDAPESRNTGRKKTGYYGQQSKEFLKKLLEGRKVRLEYDVSRKDKYRRTLAYVYLEDGTFVNAELVKKGYAMIMTVPPNVKYADKFVKLQRRARNSKKGLWGENLQ
jgi:micrococcal nuclease